MRIFVSCTTDDLGIFRDTLCEKAAEWWGDMLGLPQFSSMLDAKAESIPPVDWSIRQASRADLMVLLLGQHHGSLAEMPDAHRCGMENLSTEAMVKDIVGWSEVREPHRFSYTQWEVLAAVASHVPILLFSPDRRSNDEDLWACRQDNEPEWLKDRHACFSRWVRSRYTEDHFANRLDLANKVRKAIQRRQRKRCAWRVAVAMLALMVATFVARSIARDWRASTDRMRTEKRQADQLQVDVLRHKYAVALGGALAILGRSSVGAGRPVFERALVGLGMPQSQVGELSGEYNRMDEEVQNKRLDSAGFLESKTRLGEKAVMRLNVIKRVPAHYVEFGQSTTELLLLLQFWDMHPDRASFLSAIRDGLVRVQTACEQVELAEELRRRVESAKLSDLEVPENRTAIQKLMQQCLGEYEMDPPK